MIFKKGTTPQAYIIVGFLNMISGNLDIIYSLTTWILEISRNILQRFRASAWVRGVERKAMLASFE